MNLIDDAIDYFLIGIQRTPGRAVVRNVKNPRKWDSAQGYGLSGATLRFGGNELATFDLVLTLWTVEHWQLWTPVKPLLAKTPPGSTPKALGVWHPILAEEGIQSAVVRDATGWEPDDYGAFNKTINFIEYRAPRIAFAKPTPAIPAATAPEPTAKDAADMTILSQVAEIKGLAK